MNDDEMEFTLPPAPVGLCFNRNDFVKTSFSVDSFLEEHQDVATLETMRDDLGVYLKVLRLAMIDLIDKDYANFVNLSATLIGFDKAITKIEVPLEQLNEEVINVKQCLEDAMKEVSMWLNQRHTLHKKKQLLRNYSQTLNCLNTLDTILKHISDKKTNERIALADRAAMQYNQLKFSLTKCDSLIKPEHKMHFNDIGGKLNQCLNELVFQFWNDNDERNLLKTLLTLASLDRVKETENLLRKQAVAPLLVDIINESALQKSIDGLQGIYENILALLNTKLKVLLTVTQHSKFEFFTKRYRFLINCFWCEVESRLEVNLASIFAPGNPKIFYTRYSESMQFLKKLEQYCGDAENVKALHDTTEFKSFQKRWNLPVYFQIRFQEIAGNFESSLPKVPTVDHCEGFVLKETLSCWSSLEMCWSEDVFIDALAHKFWKLSLQLLTRYITWSRTVCSQRTTSKVEATSVNESLINNCINIYCDTQVIIQRLPEFVAVVETKIPPSGKDILHNSLKPTRTLFMDLRKDIINCIVNELSEYYNIQLKQVSDIPRLYRKTNRSVPNKPCTYIEVVCRAIKEFSRDSLKRLDNAFVTELLETLFNTMTVSYYKYVEDVLTSVQKTEDSLRRLKQIREMSSSQSNDNAGVTDGDKIRLQLNVDVVSYRQLAESLSIDVNNIHKFKELTSMVTDAVKNIIIK